MLIEILLFLFAGIVFGIFTGLTPGVHVNLVGIILISLSSSLLAFLSPIYFVVFIVAMAITHTFLDFIPSVFLGCPDTSTELSILPGHELLKKGRGYEAVMLTIYGGIAAVLILIIVAYPSIIIFEKLNKFIKILVPGLLIFASLFLISTERKMINATFGFLISGALGFIVLNLGIKQPLLPLLTGLFGGSMLIISIKDKIKIPKQKINKVRPKLLKPLIASLIASPFCSFLPGLGSGQAAIIGNTITKIDKKGFLVLLGATNTFVMGFSFLALYAISKTRTGAAAAIKTIIGSIPNHLLILILATILIAGIIDFFVASKLTKIFSQKITKIKYKTVSIISLSILIIIILIASGIIGFFVFIISTLTGIYIISLGIKRTNMMGCLLLPIIILYLI